jgi:transcription antitermination factor NusG
MQPVISNRIQPGIIPKETARWYAVYTRPHHEKIVCRQLLEQNLVAYLPLLTTLKQWSDRKKKVSIPLFSCYLFVFVNMKEYYKVVNIDGIVRYVTFAGKAVAIPEKQIQLIKNILEQGIEVEETPEDINTGAKVEIIAGPLTGICGELVDYSGKKRVIIRIEEMEKSMLVNVPLHILKLAK